MRGKMEGLHPPPHQPNSSNTAITHENPNSDNPTNSPCFDISEFLGTPHRDGGVSDEVFSNLSGLNVSPSAFGMLAPLPPLPCPILKGDGITHETDFSSLLVCPKTEESEALVSFGEMDHVRDSFTLVGAFSDNLINSSISPLAMLYPPSEGSMNYMHGNMFGTHGSFLEGDSVGILEDHMSGSLSVPNVSFGSNPCEWTMQYEEVSNQTIPVQQNAPQCDSCQVLRCIIHSNGVQDTKLEIHGCDNISYHAVLHTRFCIDDGFPTALEQQMVEFPVGNAEYVRQFLLQYSLLRRKEGFVLRHDTLSTGVDAGPGFGLVPDRVLNTSTAYFTKQMGCDLSNNACMHGNPMMSQGKLLHGENQDNAEPSTAPPKPPKSNAAAQRERTGKLKMSDLAQHFHLPINAAAKELGICPTVLKKICRRNGMRRWPHRKIKSIERIIATLEQTIAEGAGQGDEGIRMEIAMLRNERAQLCAGLLGQN